MPRRERPATREDGDLTLVEQHLQVADLLGSLLKAAAERHGITASDARVIACVHRLSREPEPVVIQAAIVAAIGLPKSRVNESVSQLSKRGLLGKAPAQDGDQRRVGLHLTPDGVEVANALIAAMLYAELQIREIFRARGRSDLLDRLAKSLTRAVQL